MFYDLNPGGGLPTPTTYESIRDAIHRNHPISDRLSESIRSHLETAVDLVALGYEQTSQGRPHLFGPLTDAGLTKALLGFELMLRAVVPLPKPCKPGPGTLGYVMKIAEGEGMIPHDQADRWRALLTDRNQLVHGDHDAPLHGVLAPRYVGFIIDMVGSLTEGK